MGKVLLVVAGFYEDIADELVRGASLALDEANIAFDRIDVPGAFEIPISIRFAMKSKEKYDGYVALGCVIRGETSHYNYVCSESAHGLQTLALKKKAAIGNGILTVENKQQAWERASVDGKNKGKTAVEACLAMIELKKRFGKK